AISPGDAAKIRDIHLLLAMFNALQPGVFALSGWDLRGVLTLDREQVRPLVARGDTRWINRGAHDLMGANPEAAASAAGMPKALNLYGTLPEQLADETSFVRQLARILKIREEYGIAEAALLDVPEVSHRGMLVMVHRLPSGTIQITALNFSGEDIAGTVNSVHLPGGGGVGDVLTGDRLGTVDGLHSFYLQLPAYGGAVLIVDEPEEGSDQPAHGGS
ncbi:maltose alpha-D-glucosyltransferase, partial [Arthrobacter deserti]|nr:maltose alpha-D-glucosyltransferase [Arthrobacter deserti]